MLPHMQLHARLQSIVLMCGHACINSQMQTFFFPPPRSRRCLGCDISIRDRHRPRLLGAVSPAPGPYAPSSNSSPSLPCASSASARIAPTTGMLEKSCLSTCTCFAAFTIVDGDGSRGRPCGIERSVGVQGPCGATDASDKLQVASRSCATRTPSLARMANSRGKIVLERVLPRNQYLARMWPSINVPGKSKARRRQSPKASPGLSLRSISGFSRSCQ